MAFPEYDEIKRLQEEVKYYRDVAAEQKAVISQLVGKPSVAWTFIHPYDLGEILNSICVNEFVPDLSPSAEGSIRDVFTYNGKKYKQSVFIPPTKIPKFL